MTTYGGERDQLAIAQEVLDRHATSSADGLCIECGVPGPCYRRETAVVIFSRYLRLPRRIPGATRPELVGARRVQAPETLTAGT
ncbi:hypothetical protein HC028_16240 [Planosporangium flavigriseum]|uniref:Uncharacterized protein n=1 Tax=Planosporangium flavigriseum TaxID=373681 RepID=A0A8J3LR21_9ACTN|nr:hypothetical protein [Planosporangium flavigriseum]NJC66041.1 hypothetical protein [Planosporangium flavigriseum]GIG75073.1 hypothetical protein Pfl04_34770 [Planosporangium flavigriseum]